MASENEKQSGEAIKKTPSFGKKALEKNGYISNTAKLALDNKFPDGYDLNLQIEKPEDNKYIVKLNLKGSNSENISTKIILENEDYERYKQSREYRIAVMNKLIQSALSEQKSIFARNALRNELGHEVTLISAQADGSVAVRKLRDNESIPSIPTGDREIGIDTGSIKLAKLFRDTPQNDVGRKAGEEIPLITNIDTKKDKVVLKSDKYDPRTASTSGNVEITNKKSNGEGYDKNHVRIINSGS